MSSRAKLGLTARKLILPSESEADFEALIDSYKTEHRPATPTEEALVAQMVMATWRLRRLYRMEAGLYNLKAPAEPGTRAKRDNSRGLRLVDRQVARLEGSFSRALQALKRLRTQRPAKGKPATPAAALEEQIPGNTWIN